MTDQPCILCAKEQKRVVWGCWGFPAWREIRNLSICIGGQIFACDDHRDAVQARCEDKLGRKFPQITGGPNGQKSS